MNKDIKKMLGFRPEAIPQIRLKDIETLIPYARNTRTHSKVQVEQIKRSMLEFGWTNPILADDLGIVAGHGRVLAAEELYRKGEQILFPNGTPIPIGQVPVVDCTEWSVEQRKAYIIADNKLALNAGWDEDLLSLELKDLDAAGFDLDVIGFDENELADLLREEELTLPEDKDPDAAPDLPDEPVSRLGDTWVLGAHRVHCGDSIDLSAWDQLMQGESADVVWTDPPYNVDVGRKNRLLDKTLGGERFATGSIANDKMTEEEFEQLPSPACSPSCSPGRRSTWPTPTRRLTSSASSLKRRACTSARCWCGRRTRSCWAWQTSNPSMSRCSMVGRRGAGTSGTAAASRPPSWR
ncbi:hypothetical protein D3C79_567000 [compost metagenome]